jgi:hypothetical protein
MSKPSQWFHVLGKDAQCASVRAVKEMVVFVSERRAFVVEIVEIRNVRHE